MLGNPFAPNMALQRTRRPRFRSGRSLRSLGSPLNARPLDACRELRRATWLSGFAQDARMVFGAPLPARLSRGGPARVAKSSPA